MKESSSPLTNGNVEEKITEFQKNASTIIAPGVKRKAVNIEKPNIGVLFSSDEINYLVYRYLLENGFSHTAWAFGSESNIHNAQFDSTQVPKGALIKILQKGVFFAEAELYSVLDGEAMEKYEKTSGTISLLESAHPPAKKKMCPVIDQRIIEKSANRLKYHRKNAFTKELESIQRRRDEDFTKIQSGKHAPRDERDTQHQMVNKASLKNLRDKEHEREKETKEHDKREKALQAAVNTGHMSNGINSPAHHRARIDNKQRVHSATPPSTSTASSNSQMPQMSSQIPQHLQQHQQQPQSINSLPQHQQLSQAQQQQIQQQQQQQQQPQTQQPQLPPSSILRMDMHHQMQQQQQQQQQQPSHHPVINHHIKEQSQPPQQQQQPTTQARGTPQPQPQPPPATQSSSGIGVVQPQQYPTFQLQNLISQMGPNWMNILQAAGGPNVNPAAALGNPMMQNGFGIDSMKMLHQALQQQQAQAGHPQQQSGVNNNPAGSNEHHQPAPQQQQQHQLLKLHSNFNIPSTFSFVMDLETDEHFSVSWNTKITNLMGMGFSFGNARIWHLPFDIPITKWEVNDLKRRWQHLSLPNKNVNDSDKNKKSAMVPTTVWNSEGTLMATACSYGSVKIWDTGGVFKRNLEGHSGAVMGASFSPNGSRIFTIGIDRKIIVWETNSSKQLQVFYIRKVIDYHWLNDEIFAVSAEIGVLILHISEPTPLREIRSANGEVNTIRFDRFSTMFLACGYDDSKIDIWDIKKTEPITSFHGHNRAVHTLRWCPKGQFIGSIAYDNRMIVWDAFTQQTALSYEHEESMNSLAFSPNGRYIAATSFDGRVFVWNIDNGTQLISLCYKVQFYEISWNCTGDWLSSSAPGYVLLADLKQTIQAHEYTDSLRKQNAPIKGITAH